jgi:DNA-binding response OmpR family regulator
MKHILLVEDDPLLIDIYSTKFKNSGFEVAVADSGEKVLELAKKTQAKVILLDIVLPHMDGWEILRQVKEDKELAHVRVVVLSNLGQKEEVEKGIKLGAALYLIKAHHTPSQVIEQIQSLWEK